MVVCGGFKTRHKSMLYSSHSRSFPWMWALFPLKRMTEVKLCQYWVAQAKRNGWAPPSISCYFWNPDTTGPRYEVTLWRSAGGEDRNKHRLPDVWVSHAHLPATVQPAQLTPSRSEVSCPYFFAQIADLGAKSLVALVLSH